MMILENHSGRKIDGGFLCIRTIAVAAGVYTQVQDVWTDLSILHKEGETTSDAMARHEAEMREHARKLERRASLLRVAIRQQRKPV